MGKRKKLTWEDLNYNDISYLADLLRHFLERNQSEDHGAIVHIAQGWDVKNTEEACAIINAFLDWTLQEETVADPKLANELYERDYGG